MLNFRDMVLIQMKKHNIMSLKELCDEMNKVNDGGEFTVQQMGCLLKGKRREIRYIYRMEEVFGLPRNFLINMNDLSCVPKRLLKGDEEK